MGKKVIAYAGLRNGKTFEMAKSLASTIQEWFMRDGTRLVEIRATSQDYAKAVAALKKIAAEGIDTSTDGGMRFVTDTLRELGEL